MDRKELIFLEPLFKQMIWGGSRLGSVWGYEVPGSGTGECWAVSAHENGDCKVAAGSFAGKTLSRLWKEEPQLFGNVDKEGKLREEKFPLLTKIIDAKEDLSIQVHPDDAYAGLHENGSLGKTECWYILDCPADATLVIGHHASNRKEMEEMISQGRWKEFLREVPVKKGDFIQIDPGTLHAIKGGIMLLETQQSSDVTYRVYDYDRLSDGKPRQLHIRQSMAVMQVPAAPVEECVFPAKESVANEPQLMMENAYYQVSRLEVKGQAEWLPDKDFYIVSVLEGGGAVSGTEVKKGDHFIIPVEFGQVILEGEMSLLLSAPGKK